MAVMNLERPSICAKKGCNIPDRLCSAFPAYTKVIGPFLILHASVIRHLLSLSIYQTTLILQQVLHTVFFFPFTLFKTEESTLLLNSHSCYTVLTKFRRGTRV